MDKVETVDEAGLSGWFDSGGNFIIADSDEEGKLVSVEKADLTGRKVEKNLIVFSPIDGPLILNDAVIGKDVFVKNKRITGGIEANEVTIDGEFIIESGIEAYGEFFPELVEGNFELRDADIGAINFGPKGALEVVDATDAEIELMFFCDFVKDKLILKRAEIGEFLYEAPAGGTDIDVSSATIKKYLSSKESEDESFPKIRGDHDADKYTDIPKALAWALDLTEIDSMKFK